MRCLVVDDNTICREAVALILREIANCDDAVDGNDAVAKFSAALRNKEPYDVIFMDILMPGMDGHDAAKEIRRIEMELDDNTKVPIIMLTILDSVNDSMKAFCYAHSVAYIVKPANEGRILSTLKELDLL